MIEPKPTNIYVAAPEGSTGKSLVALGLLETLAGQVEHIGVFRPVVRSPDPTDDRLGVRLVDAMGGAGAASLAVGVTYAEVHDDPDGALERIVTAYRELAAGCGVVIAVGSDYTDVATPTEFAFNGQMAANMGTPVLLVVSAYERSPAEVALVADIAMGELAGSHAETVGLVANRCADDALDEIRAALAATGLPHWALPEQPLLSAPRLEEIRAALDAEVLIGDPSGLEREVEDSAICAMTVDHVLERLRPGELCLVPGDRSDILIALAAANRAPDFPSLSGLVLNGGFRPSPAALALLEGLDGSLPVLWTPQDSYRTARIVTNTRGRLATGTQRKVDVALATFDAHVERAEIVSLFDVPRTQVVTPLMFEATLVEAARAKRRRIVLPEGTDERILRAASTLLSRGVADLVLLGAETEITTRAGALGLDVSAASIIDPRRSELLDEFAAEYARLRAHKGITLEVAHDLVRDVSTFGTMMVQLGYADGMVSGATHSTAHTVTPAFQIIKTVEGTTKVSSVFFMCLADRVLVYGDCAVIPDPTAEELADIAIASADTASRFGVEPRVAMLSYSTGESGTGADVDKVRLATDLVIRASPGSRDRRADAVRRSGRCGRRRGEAARFSGGGPGDGVHLPRPEHRQQHLQGGATLGGCGGDRAGAPGAAQTCERPLPGGDGARHHQHRGDHRGAGCRRGERAERAVTGPILVFNSGSSSVKYALLDPESAQVEASGLLERVGHDDAELHHHHGAAEFTTSLAAPDHSAAIRAVMDAFAAHGPDLATTPVAAVGHRVVMGGSDLLEPVVITDGVLASIDSLAPLAPLHNPANAATIRVARSLLPDVPHVAVFDTAFFAGLPPSAAHYAIDPALAAEHGIRRYGFHGISHHYVSTQVATMLADRPAPLRQIVLHLGNGASASAVVDGRPVETSMGLTPLEGLVMGTRSGDIDPGVAFYLHRELDMDVDAIDHLLNFESGLLGMTGTNDMRDIRARIAAGDDAAKLAVEVTVHRLVKYVGAYAAVMGGLDALTFTAGIGEGDAELRAEVVEPLGFLGARIDPALNARTGDTPRHISSSNSTVAVLVVPTREELSIARQTSRLLA